MASELNTTPPSSGMLRLSQQETVIRNRPAPTTSSDWLCRSIGRAFADRDNDDWMIDSDMEDRG